MVEGKVMNQVLRSHLQLSFASIFLHAVCILISVSSQRRCAFHVTPRNYKFTDAGNVNGSVQVCKDTQCCVGYYVVVNGRPEVNILGEEMQTRTAGLG